jgi:hypothetical protein
MPSTKPGGKEVTQIVRIDQPFCVKTWGLTDLRGQCPGFLGIHGAQKCFNTRKTCPVPLSYSAGERYLLFSGASGQFAWAPDAAVLDITGDIDIVAKIQAADYTPATFKVIAAKRGIALTAAVTSYVFWINTDGSLNLLWSDGASVITVAASVLLSSVAADGTDIYVRSSLDVDDGAAHYIVKFFTSADGKTWTQLGATVTNAGPTSIRAGTEILEVGSQGTGASGNWNGRIYYVEVRNGIGGQPVAVFDINDATVDAAGQITSSRTGEVWTVGASPAPTNIQTTIGFRDLLFAPGQSGVQKYYSNATATIQKMATAPETLNLSGLEGKSELLLGQRETVTVEIRNDLSADFLVDKYRLERLTALSATKYLSLPGTASNYGSTPDSAAASITGDLTIRALVAMDDWTPGAEATLIAKWTVTGNQRSYALVIAVDGKIKLYWSNDGTAVLSATSTLPITITNGQKLWVIAFLDVDNGAGGKGVSFLTSLDFNPFDGTGTAPQLGTTVTTGGTTSIFDGTAPLTVGAHDVGASGSWAGKMWYADVSHTTPAAVFNPQSITPGITSFPADPTGETWTINQSGSPAASIIAEAAAYDPYTKGTRLGKFIARNPYSSGYNASVYDGVVGQALTQMTRRQYLVKGFDGPSSNVMTLTMRDFFDKISERKATAPFANRGELFADMTGSPATFTLFPAGIGNSEYAASGYVRVDREIIQYTRAGDVMTVVLRGALGTVQSDHKDEDRVQQVLIITSMTVKDIIYLLLVTYGKIPMAWIDSFVWTQASTAIGELYSAVISEPVAVATLLGELMELVGVSVFPNVKTGLIDFVPLRPAVPLATIDDQTWIVKGSMKAPKRLDTRRVSRCLIRYGPKDPTADMDEENNYRSRSLVVDAASEGPTQYGSVSLKVINSRWIPQFGGAIALGHATRIVGMFRDPPLQAEFRLTAPRADSIGLQLASSITLKTWDSEDFYGDPAFTTHAVVRLARDPAKDEVEVRTLETKFGPGVIIDKTVYVADDTTNINFRTAWSQLFGVPQSTDTPKCVVLAGIFVGGGSKSGTAFAFDVGDWPAGIVPDITIDGEILPAGGDGGNGGNASWGTFDINGIPNGDESSTAGTPGENGAPGFRTTIPIILRGSGVIRGGFPGGGGGGGGAASGQGTYFAAGGGPGAPARGFPVGNVGAPGGGENFNFGRNSQNATAATAATRFSNGTGGLGQLSYEFNGRQVRGGSGGDGNVNNAGTAFNWTGQALGSTHFSVGGSVGTRGLAIQGNSLITFTGWTGTVDGATAG